MSLPITSFQEHSEAIIDFTRAILPCRLLLVRFVQTKRDCAVVFSQLVITSYQNDLADKPLLYEVRRPHALYYTEHETATSALLAKHFKVREAR